MKSVDCGWEQGRESRALEEAEAARVEHAVRGLDAALGVPPGGPPALHLWRHAGHPALPGTLALAATEAAVAELCHRCLVDLWKSVEPGRRHNGEHRVCGDLTKS
eukprot:1181771-Prorocentrum_minimum.AAC.1